MTTSGMLLLIFGCSLLGCQGNDFKNEDHSNVQEKATTNSRAHLFDYPTSDQVYFSIQASKEYLEGKTIDIVLTWKNQSDSSQKINVTEYWDHPIGIGASIVDNEENELVKYSSTHFLSSQLYFEGELKNGEIVLDENEFKIYEIDLMKIPVFKNSELNQTKNLPRGNYRIRLFYHKEPSSELEIKII